MKKHNLSDSTSSSPVYLITNDSARASIFGIGTYVNAVGRLLADSPIDATVIHLNSLKSEFFSREIIDGVEHWHIPAPKLKWVDTTKRNELYSLSVVQLLRQYIPAGSKPIFHLNFISSQSLCDFLKEFFDCYTILTVHYLNWEMELNGNITHFRLLKNADEASLSETEVKIYRSFLDEKQMFGKVDRLICLSEHTADLLACEYEVDPNRISIIYNGLKNEALSKNSYSTLREKYRIPVDSPVVLFAGRLDPIKGVSYILKATDAVIQKYPDCHFIFAGSGDFDQYLKLCGANWMNIHFIGLLDKVSLYELYSIANIGLMPSLHEQCSYVAIEMMMHGLPMIGSTSTGLKEMIEHELTGFHVPVIEYEGKVELDAEQLARYIIRLIEDSVLRDKMSKDARERYDRLYSHPVMLDNMIKYYMSLGIC